MKKVLQKLDLKTEYFEVRTDSSEYLPPLQSHRGYRNSDSQTVENTLRSIKNSFELGYLMVEFDVRLTADQKVILYHDDKINGQLISKMSLQQVQQITNVDLLCQVFEWFTQNQLKNFKLNIEIKSKSAQGRLEKHVYLLIKEFNMEKNILISSFNPLSLMYFRLFDSSIFRSLLLTYAAESGNNIIIKSMVFNILARPNALHLNQDFWNVQKFKKLLDKKIPIVLWTCNDLNLVKDYLDQGITGVISDVITPEQI